MRRGVVVAGPDYKRAFAQSFSLGGCGSRAKVGPLLIGRSVV